jgi:AP-3 complex subunit beta
MSYQRQPTLQYFSAIVKNIASPNLEIKKLVYAYVVAHAEEAPDTALLSINTIQKSLSDSNPHLRALALRTMSSIRVPVISQIVALGIKRGTADMSPYVRRAAALAIPKCFRLDPNTQPLLEEQISILLGDKQYYVAGGAVMAFLEVCPERLDLVHTHYRSLVRKLVDMDEWGQLATLRLMMVYVRKCFPRKTKRVKRTRPGERAEKVKKDFYDDSNSDDDIAGQDGDMEDVVVLDPDLELFLRSAQSLLQSRNAAVIVAVARCYLYLGNTTYLDLAIGPLISLLRAAPDIQNVALYNIVQICLLRPEPFVPYASHFLLRATDDTNIQDLKLEMLTLLFPQSPPHIRSLILTELSQFSHSNQPHLVRAAMEAIGRCAQTSPTPELGARCLRLLLAQLSSADSHLVASSLDVIRHLIQKDPTAHDKTIVRLAKNLDTLMAPSARASIIWLVGEFASASPAENIAADMLRILARGFASEALIVKQQIVLLAAKVYLQHLNATKDTDAHIQPANTTQALPLGLDDGGWAEKPSSNNAIESLGKQHPIPLLWNYILLLARYDTSYDIRDRARLYRSLLSTPSSTDLAALLLLAPKPVPQAPSPSESRRNFALGSASLVIGESAGVGGLRGYEALPDWVREGEEPDPRLRDEGAPAYGETREVSAGDRLDAASKDKAPVPKPNGVGEKSLDDWLAEGEESEEETEEESEDEESEEETEEESEEEETDEEGEMERFLR